MLYFAICWQIISAFVVPEAGDETFHFCTDFSFGKSGSATGSVIVPLFNAAM